MQYGVVMRISTSGELSEVDWFMYLPTLQEELAQQEHANEKLFAKWKAQSATLRDSLKMSGDAAPWTRAPTTKLRGLPQTPRVRDLVNVGFGARMKQNPNMSTLELKQGLWANPSQSIARKPWSVVPATTTTSCELYSYEADAVLSGLAMMRCMGHPSDSCPIECFSERDLRSRAGESFSVPIIAVLTYAFYLSPFAPWWQ
jgi:hypothetical protein